MKQPLPRVKFTKGPVTTPLRIKLLRKIAQSTVTGLLSQFFFSRCVSRTWFYFLQCLAATCTAISQCISPSTTLLAIFESLSLAAHAQSFFPLFLRTVILNFAPNNSLHLTAAKKIASC